MYLYFDKSGTLREMINDEALRQYNQNINTMFVYIEGEYSGGVHKLPTDSNGNYIYQTFVHSYELPDGTSSISTPATIAENKVQKSIEFNRKRDLEFFKYGQQYEFIKIDIPNVVFEHEGVIGASIQLNPSVATALTLGIVVFNVEHAVTLPSDKITVSQFEYLLNYVSSHDIDIIKNFASEYNSEQSYSEGDYVIYNRKLYKALETATGEWDSDKWEAVEVGTELKTLRNDLGDLGDQVAEIEEKIPDDTSSLNPLVNKVQLDTKQDKTGFFYKTKIKPYLYTTIYESLDYDYATEYMNSHFHNYNGGCSAVSKGDFVGRNFDGNYDNEAAFVVRVSRSQSRYASVGAAYGIKELTDLFANSNQNSELYKVLPFFTRDGVNEKGVYCNINIVYAGDKGITSGTTPAVTKRLEICGKMLVRYILDNFATAKEAVEYIRDYVSVYGAKTTTETQEFHFLVRDLTNTYILEFVNNALVILSSTDSDFTNIPNNKDIMTNFYLTGWNGQVKSVAMGNSVAEVQGTGLTDHALGLERYNIASNAYSGLSTKEDFVNLMTNSLKYTKTYKSDTYPFWYSEYNGEYAGGTDLTIYSEVSAYNTIKTEAMNRYQHRSRDESSPYFGTWQTEHSSIYDIKNKKLYLYVQEDGEELKSTPFEIGFSNDKVYFNTNLSVEEMKTMFSKLPFNDYGNCNILFCGSGILTITVHDLLAQGETDTQEYWMRCFYTKNGVAETAIIYRTQAGIAYDEGWQCQYIDELDENGVWTNPQQFTVSTVINTDFMSSNKFYIESLKNAVVCIYDDKENVNNKVKSISSKSTDEEYPSAKCVYDLIGDIETTLKAIRGVQ